MSDVKNILLVGVGGQGTILASKVLATGLINAGYDVKMSEVHGMAQRGGSVTTQVRFGQNVESPIIGKGQADILVSFERMEALRYLDYLKPNGKVIINDFQMPPVSVLTGDVDYPKGILEDIKGKVDTLVFGAEGLAKKLGNIKSMNIILLGALVKAMGLLDIDWEEVIKDTVKEKFVDLNLKAIKVGMEQI